MAKARIIPPRKSIQKTVQTIIKNGPKLPVKTTISKGTFQNKATAVKASRIPQPAQNQRGRIKSKDEKDLTR